MPLPKKLTRTIKKFARRDHKISKKFYPYDEKPGDLKLYVLRQDGRSKKFEILAVIDDWGVEFSTYWQRTVFSVSTIREDLGKNGNETFYQVVLKSTHLAKNGELYSTKEGTGIQAFQFEFGYKVLGSHQAQLSFSLADTV